MYSTISATDLTQWADRREAQSKLPVLVRRLIHCSGLTIRSINFPGGDSVQLGGFDGTLEAEAGNIWVPAGTSVWEMGCDRKVKQKADDDYLKRTASVPEGDRQQSTFVFVTPRRWTAKANWMASRKAEGQWRDVQCLDADDLEQWVETSQIVAAWLGRAMGRKINGLMSGSDYWQKWSGAATPPIPAALLLAGRDALVAKLIKLIEGQHDRAITVAADSRHEALAFVCAALGTQETISDRLLVAELGMETDSIGEPKHQILALSSASLEEQFAYLAQKIPLIVPFARGHGQEPDIDLEPISGEQFEDCLVKCERSKHQATIDARESGRSVTILRRRWAVTPTLAQPKWSGDSDTARRLVPFALCGAWNLDRDGDMRTLAAIANLSVEQIELDSNELRALDEAPIEAIGRYNRVVSQIDALFAIGARITKTDLDRFFSVIERAISVRDPALDLPEEERWMANILGKEHPFSGALLRGIGNTLILFAIHGGAICGQRLGMDIQGRTSSLVSHLLSDLSDEQWISIRGNLRLLAEAAPDAFLRALENDLAKASPSVMALMRVTKGGAVGGECLRTELLWALELLAWSPQTYGRVVDILAVLSRIPLDDNWMNKPANSLHSLFRTWLPKTSAPLELRIDTLRRLFGTEPEVAFKQAISLLDTRFASASDNARPRWRNDAADAGHGVSHKEYVDMALAAANLLLTKPNYSLEQLQKILPIIGLLPSEHQSRFWHIVNKWSLSASDRHKANLRETLRRFVAIRSKRKEATTEAELAYRMLEPTDLCERHRWLFESRWLEFSADELEENTDFDIRRKHADKSRVQALREIFAARGGIALLEFSLAVNEPGLAAGYIANELSGVVSHLKVIEYLSDVEVTDPVKFFRRGFFAAINKTGLKQVLQNYVYRHANGSISRDELIDAFCDAPVVRAVWDILDGQSDEEKKCYWLKINAWWYEWSAEDAEFAIGNLLEAGRPRSAFSAIRLDKELVSGKSIAKILQALLTGDEPDVSVPPPYDIGEAFKLLDREQDLDKAILTKLEFGFAKALLQTERGIPILSRQLVEMPAHYVQMLSYMYRRDDKGRDPEGWEINDKEQARVVGDACSDVIEHWNVVKNFTQNDVLDESAFKEWVSSCRAIAAEVARSGIVDLKIGTMLAWKAHHGKERWPDPAVCDVLENVGTASMRDGFHTGVLNARGMTSRGAYEGGQQERDLARRFDDYAGSLESGWPKTAATMRNIAKSYRSDGDWNDRRARLNQIYDL